MPDLHVQRLFQLGQVDEPAVPETALLSEPSLAEDWSRPEEEAAWSHLQPKR